MLFSPIEGDQVGGLKSRSILLPTSIVSVLVVGIVLRVVHIGYSPWFDEYASVIFSNQPSNLLWSDWMVRETNPPLYYFILKTWRAVFGSGIPGMRMLSILVGIAGVVLTTAYCYRWYGPRAALAAAAFLSVSAQHIYYSQQMRGYIFEQTAIIVSLVGITVLVLDPKHRRLGALGYAAGGLFAIYCHTTMLLWPPIATAAAVIVAWSMRGPLKGMLPWLVLANILIAVGAYWWLTITLMQVHNASVNIAWLKHPTARSYRYILADTIMLVRGQAGHGYVTARLILLLSILGSVLTWRQKPATRLVTLICIFSIGGFAVASVIHPIIVDRTVFWMGIFPTILAAVAIGAIRDARYAGALAAACVVLLAMNLAVARPDFEVQPWNGFMHKVASDRQGVLLVESKAMQQVAKTSCDIAFSTPCPVRIVSLREGMKSDSWANDLSGAPLSSALQLASEPYARTAHFYTIRYYGNDPAKRLGFEQASNHFAARGPFVLDPDRVIGPRITIAPVMRGETVP